jgi:Mg2+/Co2+ transporter CorC
MVTENTHPSEELRATLQQTPKRELLYTEAMLSIEEEVTLAKHLRKAKVISSAEEHECGAAMPMSHKLAGCIQEVLTIAHNCYAVHSLDIDLVEIQKQCCGRAVSSTLQKVRVKSLCVQCLLERCVAFHRSWRRG